MPFQEMRSVALVVWTSKSGLNQMGAWDWFFDSFENTSFPRSEPLYLIRTTKSRSRPEISGFNHFFLVQTTGVERTRKSGINHGFWFEPACAVWTRNSGLNQLPIG